MNNNINKEFLDLLYSNMKEYFSANLTTSGSPKPLFLYDVFRHEDDESESEIELSDYIFNKNNWNSGQDLLRSLFLGIWDGKITIDDNCDLIIKVLYKEDDWTGVIIDEENNDIYISNWYKSRGTTSSITKNGELINLEEYLEILNKLNNLNIDLNIPAVL